MKLELFEKSSKNMSTTCNSISKRELLNGEKRNFEEKKHNLVWKSAVEVIYAKFKMFLFN